GPGGSRFIQGSMSHQPPRQVNRVDTHIFDHGDLNSHIHPYRRISAPGGHGSGARWHLLTVYSHCICGNKSSAPGANDRSKPGALETAFVATLTGSRNLKAHSGTARPS